MALTIPSIDFGRFHEQLFQRQQTRVESPLVGDLQPLAFCLPNNQAVTYRLVNGVVGIEMSLANDAVTVIEMNDAAFAAFASEYLTAPGLQIQQMISFRRGDYGQFDAWEPVLRSLYSQRPIYDPNQVPTDVLDTAFIWGSSSTVEIADFLHAFGFAVVRNVFSPAEVDAFDREIDRLTALASPSDGQSWWVQGAAGDDRVCQLHYTSLLSELFAGLESDDRMQSLVNEVDQSFVPHPEIGNGHFAVVKNPGVTGGLTDLPWHVDCGLGGHPVLCPSLHIGVQIRAMNEHSGEMKFLAGSHLACVPRPTKDQLSSLPVVTVHAEPGDITLHFPDALHAAPPPNGSGEGRRTLYLSYGRPELSTVFGYKQGYDQMLFKGDGHVEFNY